MSRSESRPDPHAIDDEVVQSSLSELIALLVLVSLFAGIAFWQQSSRIIDEQAALLNAPSAYISFSDSAFSSFVTGKTVVPVTSQNQVDDFAQEARKLQELGVLHEYTLVIAGYTDRQEVLSSTAATDGEIEQCSEDEFVQYLEYVAENLSSTGEDNNFSLNNAPGLDNNKNDNLLPVSQGEGQSPTDRTDTQLPILSPELRELTIPKGEVTGAGLLASSGITCLQHTTGANSNALLGLRRANAVRNFLLIASRQFDINTLLVSAGQNTSVATTDDDAISRRVEYYLMRNFPNRNG